MLRRVKAVTGLAETCCIESSASSFRSHRTYDEVSSSADDWDDESTEAPNVAEAKLLGGRKNFSVILLFAASGAATLGMLSGVVGLITGIAAGSMVGALPVVITLGVSLPVCVLISASTGFLTGVVAGTSAGAFGGGAVGLTTCSCAVEIEPVVCHLKEQVDRSCLSINGTGRMIQEQVFELVRRAVTVSKELVWNCPRFQALSTTAAIGSAAGGFVGTCTGGAIGTLLGMSMIFFTFGLSVPTCACFCGCIGLCVGTIIGGSAGVICGELAARRGCGLPTLWPILMTTATMCMRHPASICGRKKSS
eukprot:NODE_12486_length_1221_cov_16.812614.p1 GENE.NODE_12486_length_1221_cov_16.812614~~NODE_12486_length_1221_cov_16.812614.p1  ORF type:complete len:307 (+),score=31.96 NODE_12486_length_1221_cov_16.812614:136-1056(+)